MKRQLAPLALNPTFVRQPVQGREERPRTHHKHAARHLLNAIRNAHAVKGFQLERPQNQEVECSLKEIRRFTHDVD